MKRTAAVYRQLRRCLRSLYNPGHPEAQPYRVRPSARPCPDRSIFATGRPLVLRPSHWLKRRSTRRRDQRRANPLNQTEDSGLHSRKALCQLSAGACRLRATPTVAYFGTRRASYEAVAPELTGKPSAPQWARLVCV